MEMRNFAYLLLLSLSFCPQLLIGQGPYDLRVINPKKPWQNQSGVIESATLSIKPKGLFAEYGLYLTFSERWSGTHFTDDSLEVVLYFELPEAAIVHDSWLWIDDEIAVARIMDRLTASQIYDENVAQRSDPSKLVKDSPKGYTLRVYPLIKGSTRRVKITYMMPVMWTRHAAMLELPTNIFRVSRIHMQQFNILMWPEQEWDTPELVGVSGPQFVEYNDAPGGNAYFRAELPYSEWIKKPRVKFNDPVPSGIYVNKWNDDVEGIYQLAVVPAVFAENPVPRKAAILFDHQTNGSPEYPYTEWLRNTRIFLENILEPTDSFNLFFGQLNVTPHSPVWMPANPATINQVFENLSTTPSSSSHLPGLLSSAIQFIQNNGGDGHILLETNSSQFANLTQYNSLISDVLALMGQSTIPVSSVDFRSVTSGGYVGGFYGDGYMLTYLAQQTGGGYFSARANSWLHDAMLEQGFNNLWDKITNFEVSTSVQNGFSYGRLTPLHSAKFASPVFTPVLQIGKFNGQFPMNISITGEINGNLFNRNIQIQEAQAYSGDTLNSKMWHGTFIQALERDSPSNFGGNQIISQSISSRVLSRYTAFICLEDPNTYCDDCFDETVLTSAFEAAPSDSLIRVAPNPFVESVEIEIKGLNTDSGRTTMEVFDLSGRLISVLHVEANGNRALAVWRGQDTSGAAVPPGVYVVLIRNKHLNKAVRVVKGRA